MIYQIADKSEPYNIGLLNIYLTGLLKKHLNEREYDVLRLSYGLDCEKHSANKIAEILNISRATVSNIKKRYREEGLQSALTEKTRPGQPKKYTERHEAEIIAQACTKSPDGRKRWSLTLLTEEMRKKEGFETINRESIRLILKKAKRNHG